MRKELVSLDDVPRAELVDSKGRTFAEFRRSLKPRWSRVAFDLVLGYAGLIGTAVAMALAYRAYPTAWPAIVLAGGLGFGYWHAYLQLFMHEAAHFNLAPDKKWNDRIASALVAVWIGSDIVTYRAVHWDHHKHHGKTDDTEHQYFSALSARFVFETLFMIRALRLMLAHRSRAKAASANRPTTAKTQGSGRAMLLAGMVLNVAILAGLVLAGLWPIALARIVGVGMFLPFFVAVRQLLEHRSLEASAAVDYTKEAHGRTTRMFHEGPIGSTFGAAGFTRHLLHHWEPSISYTNLAEVEAFLLDCAVTRELGLAEAKTTYVRAFIALYGR